MSACEPLTASGVAAALAARRYSFVSERSLQRAVGSVLESAFPGAFRAEVKLGDAGRIDFLAVREGVGIEAKAYRTGGTPSDVLQQLLGYALHPEICSLVLVAGSPALVSALPDRLHGKTVIGVIAQGSLV